MGKSRSGKPDLGSLRVLGQLATRDHLRKHGKSFRKPNRCYQGIGLDNRRRIFEFLHSGWIGWFSLSIDEFTGSFSFVSPPDFEQALDLDENGEYQLTIGVSDGTSISEQLLRVSLYDVDEAPTIDQITIPFKISFPEDSRVTYDFNGTQS